MQAAEREDQYLDEFNNWNSYFPGSTPSRDLDELVAEAKAIEESLQEPWWMEPRSKLVN